MQSRSKKYSVFAAVVVLSLGAAACGSDEASDASTAISSAVSTLETVAEPADTTAATTAATTAETTAETTGDTAAGGDLVVPEDMSIVYVPGLTGNPFYNTVACGAQTRSEELGIEFSYQGAPEFDAAKQSAIVSAIIADKPDAIMISITDQDAMIQPLQEAKDAGIQLVGIDGDLSDKSILSTNIQSDNLIGGALAAKSLVAAVGEDVGGDVVGITNTPGNPIGEQRVKGFVDELAKYPAFNYLGTQYSSNKQAEAAKIVSTTAGSNPNLVGVYTMNTNSTEGGITGLREADKSIEDIKIVGYDMSAPILEALTNGDVTGLVVQFPFGAGVKGVENAVALVNGETIERNQATDFVFATPENVDTPEVQKFLYKLECDA